MTKSSVKFNAINIFPVGMIIFVPTIENGEELCIRLF